MRFQVFSCQFERSCCLQYAGFDLEESPEVEHIQFEV